MAKKIKWRTENAKEKWLKSKSVKWLGQLVEKSPSIWALIGV